MYQYSIVSMILSQLKMPKLIAKDKNLFWQGCMVSNSLDFRYRKQEKLLK